MASVASVTRNTGRAEAVIVPVGGAIARCLGGELGTTEAAIADGATAADAELAGVLVARFTSGSATG